MENGPLIALVMALSFALSFFMSGMEAGVFALSRLRIRPVMQESAQAFTSEERAMINRVLDLQHLSVGQIAVPLVKAVTVTSQTPMSDVLRLCRERNLTRLPVWQNGGDRRRVAGVVSLKTLLYQSDLDVSRTAGDYVKSALYLNDETRVEEALRRMQRSGQRLGIVLGRDQRELGVVSLHDILKFIFGEVSL